jgi:NitT/TauT family transport system permease protein
MSDKANTPVSPEHLVFLRSVKLNKLKIIAVQVLLLVGLILLWEMAANLRLINPFITSQPSRVIATLISLYNEGNLFYHIGVTIFETVVGFTLGTIIGTGVAILLWWSDFLARVLDPYLVVLNSLPKIALGPILIVWIGNGMQAIIAMALLISVVVTILGVYSGFVQVDPERIKLLKTFGATQTANHAKGHPARQRTYYNFGAEN